MSHPHDARAYPKLAFKLQDLRDCLSVLDKHGLLINVELPADRSVWRELRTQIYNELKAHYYWHPVIDDDVFEHGFPFLLHRASNRSDRDSFRNFPVVDRVNGNTFHTAMLTKLAETSPFEGIPNRAHPVLFMSMSLLIVSLSHVPDLSSHSARNILSHPEASLVGS